MIWLQSFPALRGDKPTGEYRYDGNVANRALELLGKQQGMFIDRHEVVQPNEFANWRRGARSVH